MVQQLATLNEKVEKRKVVGKFLWSVPHRYQQIVVAIQSLLDVDTLTLVNVTGIWRGHKSSSRLLHRRWTTLANYTRRPRRKNGSSVTTRKPLATGQAAEEVGGMVTARTEDVEMVEAATQVVHRPMGRQSWVRINANIALNLAIVAECKNRPKKELVNVAQELEEALMMIQASIMSESSPNLVLASDGERAATTGWILGLVESLASVVRWRKEQVHLHEEKVFVQLGVKEDRDAKS
jgi:hypothetical protein